MIYVIILISILSSQDVNTDTFSESNRTIGSVGTVTINGQVYNQLSLRPEIPIGKLGIGLDISLYFNDDGMYWRSWDFTSVPALYNTILDKIYYLRYLYVSGFTLCWELQFFANASYLLNSARKFEKHSKLSGLASADVFSTFSFLSVCSAAFSTFFPLIVRGTSGIAKMRAGT